MTTFGPTTFGPHHFWSAPLSGHTTFGPDRLLAQTTFFDRTVLCPNLCEPSLTPKNLGQCHVLFLGPWSSLRGNPLAQDHPVRDPPLCCVVCRCCCVVLWFGVSVRCVFKIFVGASKIWALPPTPPPPDPLRQTAQNSALFLPSPATIFILSSSLGAPFVEFWWCF